MKATAFTAIFLLVSSALPSGFEMPSVTMLSPTLLTFAAIINSRIEVIVDRTGSGFTGSA